MHFEWPYTRQSPRITFERAYLLRYPFLLLLRRRRVSCKKKEEIFAARGITVAVIPEPGEYAFRSRRIRRIKPFSIGGGVWPIFGAAFVVSGAESV